MKSKSLLLFVCMGLVLLLCLVGCGLDNHTEYPEIAVSTNNELGCVELIHDGTTYRPYGVVGSFFSLRGEQIGIRKDEPNSKICEVKGYQSSEWLIDYLDVFMGGGDMLFKAVGVTEIPVKLEQYKEYDF